MIKNIIISLILLFYVFQLNAQTKTTAYGFVMDSLSQTYLQGVSINNKSNNYKARTNQSGRFGIRAHIGDKIEFSHPGYEKKTIEYTRFYYELDTIRIVLNPMVTTLQDVVVSAYNYYDYQRDSAERRKDFIEANGTVKNTFDRNNTGSGLGISIDNLFSKREKRKRNAYKRLELWEQEEYIKFRYNPVLLHSLTGLTGEKLQSFMKKTEPSYKWLRNHTTRDDMFYYINDQMKKFYK